MVRALDSGWHDLSGCVAEDRSARYNSRTAGARSANRMGHRHGAIGTAMQTATRDQLTRNVNHAPYL